MQLEGETSDCKREANDFMEIMAAGNILKATAYATEEDI
jgi:hypothetical protein